MSLADDVEVAVAGRPGVVAVGVGTELLPALLSARRHTRGRRWRVACPPDVVDDLGRAFPLGTAVAEACARGAIALRAESDSRSARTVFATDGRVDAVAGPAGDRTLVTDVETLETIQREMEFSERGSRPSTAGVGHTGYLVVARVA